MAGVPCPPPSGTILLARDVSRAAVDRGGGIGCGVARARPTVGVWTGCRLSFLLFAVCQPGTGLNVRVDCRGLDVTCGGLRRSTSASFGCALPRRVGTAVNLSSGSPEGGPFETQLRVHASHRSPGWVWTASRIASPLSQALIRPGRPDTDTDERSVAAVVAGGCGVVLSSTTIRKLLPGSHSVLGAEKGTALGERESPA